MEWSRGRPVDPARPTYAATVGDNLFRSELHPKTEHDFRSGDGAELNDSKRRPAKMRAHISSSALAVNFFDAWRDSELSTLTTALGIGGSPDHFCFEYKPSRYPVGPRSPNLDILLTLVDGHRVGVESKFAEPFRTPGADALMSPKYFPKETGLWSRAGLVQSQRIVQQLSARWQYLDVAQLLKHMLGLASEDTAPATLLYLWYDTGLPDSELHRQEVIRFAEETKGDRVAFVGRTYQETFVALHDTPEPDDGWRGYMARRYFSPALANTR